MLLLTGLTTISSTQVENNNLTTSSTDSPSENGNDYPPTLLNSKNWNKLVQQGLWLSQ